LLNGLGMNRLSPFNYVALLTLLCLAACSDESDDGVTPEPGVQGAAGAPGASGRAGNPGSGGVAGAPGASGRAGNPGSGGVAGAPSVASDYDTLLACTVADACEPADTQLVENFMRSVDETRVRCVLEGLRDRKPGRYLYGTDYTDTSSSSGARHVLLVTADGGVRYGREEYRSGVNAGETAPPAQRCQLADVAYFESCLAALDAAPPPGPTPVSDALWACTYGTPASGPGPTQLGWFASCASDEPRCE
jgi:hypothetical protein